MTKVSTGFLLLEEEDVLNYSCPILFLNVVQAILVLVCARVMVVRNLIGNTATPSLA